MRSSKARTTSQIECRMRTPRDRIDLEDRSSRACLASKRSFISFAS
jgi:hypothetical protein